MKTRSLVVWMVLSCALLVVTGCSKRIAFTTATKFGLDVSQRADQTAEASIGYDRIEVIVIPSLAKSGAVKDPGEDEDTYSLLGTFMVRHGNPFPPALQPLVIHQFFATGRAAVKLAENKVLQEAFGAEAGQIFKAGQQAIKEREESK